MDAESGYGKINRELWNARTTYHLQSSFYDMEGFINGKSSLNEIELSLLGDVAGKEILHLQCHFGQDTLSLARMGAAVTGVDLSDVAIREAELLAAQLELPATFIGCNIYDLPQHLDKEFDVVFTTYGTVGWLPDMKTWAALVARYLKPEGIFVFADFHPVIWMFSNDFSRLEYSYFNTGAIVETESGTYADRSAPVALKSVGWNHGITEVLQNLLDTGLQLQQFKEYDYSPYNCFSDAVEIHPGRFQLKGKEGVLPMVYALKMIKKGRLKG
ncbi:class I SAM-dependent methyltransferase [Chitinophagaceae bacterium MMS25-I14]